MRPNVEIWRDDRGVPHVEAATEEDLWWGQGFVHGKDRPLQLLLMRILVQGRLAEIAAGEDAVRIDRFFRRIHLAAETTPQLERLDPRVRRCLERYCDGVNAALRGRAPWELRLLGHRPDPWRPGDAVALSRLIGYVGMQQLEGEAERLLVELVQAGVSREKLEELFPGLLDELDEDLLRRVTLGERSLPSGLLAAVGAPQASASNNWVLAGAKTVSGSPLLANDPHLEASRLPNVWAEIALRCGDRWAAGGGMPGAPGIVVGRTVDVAWGATYSFMDAVDCWVERCREGKYFREPDQWLPFRRRREVIRRRRGAPVEVDYYENDHGVLDGDPHQEGEYLAERWAAARSGAGALSAMIHMWRVRSVEEGMDVLGQVETAWNFVLADRHGDIGYQMSGQYPRRRPGANGFVPLAGWKPANDWQGTISHRDLPRRVNPPEGFLVTANHDLNHLGRVRPIRLSQGPYRAERITALLSSPRRFGPEDMQRMQYDLFSTQAERFMARLRPLLPDTPQGRILRKWDLRYDAESQGAWLFERFYKQLIVDVFGEGGLGREAAAHLVERTSFPIVYFHRLDRVLLADHSAWFQGRDWRDLYRRAAEAALKEAPQPWGRAQQYEARHLLLGGRTPRWLGLDRGPLPAIGGRAAIHQGQIANSHRRRTAVAPTFRFVADLSGDGYWSNLLGGPSDRPFSRWYCSELSDWLAGRYKPVGFGPGQRRRRFP